MKLSKEQTKGQELLKGLTSKAAKNQLFKRKLIESPEEAIKQFAGDEEVYFTNFSGAKAFKVEDQSNKSNIYLNIPPKPDLDNFELTEEELESVSGGCTPSTYFVIYFAAASFTYLVTKDN